jgi:hypothetical protein
VQEIRDVDCREYMYYYLTGQRDSFLKLAIDLRWTPTILFEELTGQEHQVCMSIGLSLFVTVYSVACQFHTL